MSKSTTTFALLGLNQLITSLALLSNKVFARPCVNCTRAWK